MPGGSPHTAVALRLWLAHDDENPGQKLTSKGERKVLRARGNGKQGFALPLCTASTSGPELSFNGFRLE